MSSSTILPVLIIGAGPAGLCLAHLLQRFGQKFCLIEAKKSHNALSKATGLHRNTLKLLDKIGFVDAIAEKAIQLNAHNVFLNGELQKRIEFQQGDGFNDKNLTIEQLVLEELLASTLTAKKASIHFGQKLVGFKQENDCVVAEIENSITGKIEFMQAEYLVACDGAKSTVRKILHLPFDGETTAETSFTFDASIKADNLNHNEMYTYTNNAGRIVVVPLPPSGRFKFSGRLSDEWCNQWILNHQPRNLAETWLQLGELVRERSHIHIDLDSITGLSFYHTSSRCVSSMREKRVFLIGDAAHVFFPAGGYGLNAAIEDAFSLAWRFAAIKSPLFDHELILSLFNKERIENAQKITFDSTQKKQDVESKVKETANPITEQEKQVYDDTNPTFSHFSRLENRVSTESLDLIISKTRSLSNLINKNVGFTVIVNTKSVEFLRNISSVKLSIPFITIHVCKWPCKFSSTEDTECYDVSKVPSFLENESLLFVRPDHFVLVRQIPHANVIKSLFSEIVC